MAFQCPQGNFNSQIFVCPMPEISLAPMLKVTTPQFRLLIRKISPTTVLFTEMIVSMAVMHVSDEKLQTMLGQPDPLTVVQLGGSSPSEVAAAVERLVALGWSNFNLNCGCPSDRVQSGSFGAVLMRDQKSVAAIINEVYNHTGHVLSLKIRTGVDELDSFEFFRGFVQHIIANTPCMRFYVHARKCWLNGVSPKQNRTVPPLNYQFVYDLKAAFPHIFISLNGGLKEDCIDKLQNLDGLMIGRHAVDNPLVFKRLEDQLENKACCSRAMTLKQAVKNYLLDASTFLCSRSKILIPLNNLRKGMFNNKEYRSQLNSMIRSHHTLEEVYTHIEKYVE